MSLAANMTVSAPACFAPLSICSTVQAVLPLLCGLPLNPMIFIVIYLLAIKFYTHKLFLFAWVELFLPRKVRRNNLEHTDALGLFGGDCGFLAGLTPEHTRIAIIKQQSPNYYFEFV
jgi:hypothetical protein